MLTIGLYIAKLILLYFGLIYAKCNIKPRFFFKEKICFGTEWHTYTEIEVAY